MTGWQLRSTPQPAGSLRPLVVHYHLFKNAGTSVDTILRANFAEHWRTAEFANEPRAQLRQLTQILLENREMVALSSHTLQVLPENIAGTAIFPIVFLRHPLDRLKSAHNFERVQEADTPGVRLAKLYDFAGYIRMRLSHPKDRACRDFQTWRLAMFGRSGIESEIERALKVADELPFVGLVDAFTQSMQALERMLKPVFPNFRSFEVRENSTTAAHFGLDERLAQIREELGENLFEIVSKANEGDLQLFRRVCLLYTGFRRPEVSL